LHLKDLKYKQVIKKDKFKTKLLAPKIRKNYKKREIEFYNNGLNSEKSKNSDVNYERIDEDYKNINNNANDIFCGLDSFITN